MSNSNILEISKDVLRNCDIVEVISSRIKVVKKGRNYAAVCPFHDDTNPSLMISKDKQIFKCFVCGTSGNAITFIQKFDKVNFFEATKEVAKICGYHDDRLEGIQFVKKKNPEVESLYNCLNDISNFYKTSLFQSEEGKKALEYLHNRKLDDEVIKYFDIGYSQENGKNIINFLTNKNYSIKTIERTGIGHINDRLSIKDNNAGRVIFPLKNENGQVVGFSARRINDNKDEAKYINTQSTEVFNKGTLLYNLYNAKNEARKVNYIYLVEGFMDAIALYRAGIKSVVALMGTALTSDHINELRKLGVEIRICLDLDSAGQLNTLSIIDKFSENGLNYKIVNNNVTFKEKDSDEILDKYGSEFLIKFLNNLIDRSEWLLNYYAKTLNLNNSDDKKKLVKIMMKEILKLKSNFDVDDYIFRLSKITNYDRQLLNSYYSKLIKLKEKKINNNTDFKINIPDNLGVSTDKLDKIQFKIVYYLLNSVEAINIFKSKNTYLPNKKFRLIANTIIEYFNSNINIQSIDANDFITYLSSSNEYNDINSLISDITDIAFCKKNMFPPYDKKEFLLTLDQFEFLKMQKRDKQALIETCKNLSEDQKNQATKNYITGNFKR